MGGFAKSEYRRYIEQRAAYVREWRAKNPDKVRAIKKRYREKLKADKERYERYKKRELARLRANRTINRKKRWE